MRNATMPKSQAEEQVVRPALATLPGHLQYLFAPATACMLMVLILIENCQINSLHASIDKFASILNNVFVRCK